MMDLNYFVWELEKQLQIQTSESAIIPNTLLDDVERDKILNYIFSHYNHLDGFLTVPVVQFLVEKLCEEFDLRLVRQQDEENVLSLLSHRCASLKKLTIGAPPNQFISLTVPTTLKSFTLLEIFVTHDYYLNDHSLDQLQEAAPNLKKISTRFDEVTIGGLQTLSKFRSLTHLAICKTKSIGGELADAEYMAEVLWSAPNLELLCLCNAKRFTHMLHYFNIKFGCKRLLELVKIEIEDKIPYPVTKLPNVKEVVAEHPANLQQFEAFDNIEKLSLKTAVPLEPLTKLVGFSKRLAHLELILEQEFCCPVVLPFEVFRYFRVLEYLKIEGKWYFELPDRRGSVKLEALKTCIINVEHDLFPFAFLAVIMKSKNLVRLEYSGNHRSHSFFKALTRATRSNCTLNIESVRLQSFDSSSHQDLNSMKKLYICAPKLRSLEIFTPDIFHAEKLREYFEDLTGGNSKLKYRVYPFKSQANGQF
ncbi:uncharacterized protein LOC135948143 isoform X2 [Cloeon dipterum]